MVMLRGIKFGRIVRERTICSKRHQKGMIFDELGFFAYNLPSVQAFLDYSSLIVIQKLVYVTIVMSNFLSIFCTKGKIFLSGNFGRSGQKYTTTRSKQL
jgi:hypothetical protein